MADSLLILVADDHPVYRQGLARILKARLGGGPTIEQVGSGPAALEFIRARKPDIALLDVQMPERDGLQVLEAVATEGLPTKVVLLSGIVEPDSVYRAVAAGASGFLSKVASPDSIADAVAAVAAGRTVLDDDAQVALAGAVRTRGDSRRPQLTERERQVLTLLADGLSGPQIGKELYLSTATVKSHLGTLYDKLGVSDRAAAVAVAMRVGLLT